MWSNIINIKSINGGFIVTYSVHFCTTHTNNRILMNFCISEVFLDSTEYRILPLYHRYLVLVSNSNINSRVNISTEELFLINTLIIGKSNKSHSYDRGI